MKGKTHPSLQRGLFTYKLEQLCNEANCDLKDLRLLIKEKLLSFSLNKKGYEEYEVNEARFLTSLIKSNLPIKTIKKMLSSLEKPYSYTNIYYNFITQKWLENPIPREEIDDFIKDSPELINDHIYEYLEYLSENDERERLKEILKSAAEYLEEAN